MFIVEGRLPVGNGRSRRWEDSVHSRGAPTCWVLLIVMSWSINCWTRDRVRGTRDASSCGMVRDGMVGGGHAAIGRKGHGRESGQGDTLQ